MFSLMEFQLIPFSGGGGVIWQRDTIYGDGSNGIVTYNANTSVASVNATTLTVKSGVTLKPTARLTPMILRATKSITIEEGAVLNADGKGYNNGESNNKFNLAISSHGGAGSCGISGGGFLANAGVVTPGGRAVSVNTFLEYIQQHYRELLVNGDTNIIPLFGGGGGGTASDSWCYGGGCILLVAPVINFNGIGQVRGLPGYGQSWNGAGGGGGGWFGMFGKTLNLGTNYSIEACGGGGGGGHWNGSATGGVWQNGGNSYGNGFTMGGGGGGSTALNANGGTPGVGGYGTQYTGFAGSTDGTGGGGGNYTGSDRGGRGGAGGGAGKISWLQI